MKQIYLILQREFMTRVRKKSFIILTLLTPIFFAAMMVLPSYLATMEDTDTKSIAIIDNTGDFTDAVPQTDYLKFKYIANTPVDEVKNSLEESGYYALLAIDSTSEKFTPKLTIFSLKQPSIDVISHIENSLEKEIETRKLKSYNIENLDKILDDVKTEVKLRTIKVTKDGEEKESNTLITMGIAYILGFLMYMMVLIMGNQIMQGVIEEKNNRVVEVIISSIKPINLMLGKILGLASVSLLQIFIWVILTFGLATVGISFVTDKGQKANIEQVQAAQGMMAQQGMDTSAIPTEVQPTEGNNFLTALKNQNFVLIIGGFIFYFLVGFLLYAALFAAVGSAVENITDTQQLVMPITLPLILSLFVMFSGIKSPDSPLVFWFSMIPLTSPIVMMSRLPYEVPGWQLALSASILVATFIIVTIFAAKIYRVGILMYGKKYSWKEMWKWMRYDS